MNQQSTDAIQKLSVFLKRFERRLRQRDGWNWLQTTFWIGLLGSVLVQIGARYWPVENLWLWMLLSPLLWMIAILLRMIFWPATPLQVARRLDRELGLKERLATALLLHQQSVHQQPDDEPTAESESLSELIALQQQDAVETIGTIDPQGALPLHWQQKPLVWAGAVSFGLAILLYLPNPMDNVLAERAAIAQAVEEQAEEIEKLRQEVEDSNSLSPEEREKLLKELEDLTDQLRADPQDQEEAMARLSEMEEKLRRQLHEDRFAQQEMLQALSAQLRALSKQENRGSGSSLDETLDALEQLADEFENRSKDEQAELAQALAQLASRAAQAGDVSLAQALSALSHAAQLGDAAMIAQSTDAVAQSTDAVAQSLTESIEVANQQIQLQEALEQLQQSRQAVAQAGQEQGMGQRQNPGQGQGQNPGWEQGGNSAGSGGGSQADRLPPATGQGRTGQLSGREMGSMMGDLDEQVYVPWERRSGNGDESFIAGQETGEGETQIRQRPNLLPGADSTTLVPYQEVYADYVNTANQTIERSAIPPNLKEYVRNYFIQLEP
ncbi:hypothetical protein KFU94_31620 [Chloroflexi bacterium TSY]|nr:hypothetical protein [Chloroflexi bacterium TSY]